jgi:hypothetical protein
MTIRLLLLLLYRKRTIQHIVEECPLTKFQQGFAELHIITENFIIFHESVKLILILFLNFRNIVNCVFLFLFIYIVFFMILL